jgi:CRP-like cAMP-binding protein
MLNVPAMVRRNALLAGLTPAAREAFLSCSKPLFIPAQARLENGSEIPQFCYFLFSGMASIQIRTLEGGRSSIGLIGAEGFTGALSLLGELTPVHECVMQVCGEGLRIKLKDLHGLLAAFPELRTRTLGFIQHQTFCMAQMACCNNHHDAQSRLARFLLTVAEVSQNDFVQITQEALAELLGVRRTTVTLLLGLFQNAGVLACDRGRVTIKSKLELTSLSCPCHSIMTRQILNLYGDHQPSLQDVGSSAELKKAS